MESYRRCVDPRGVQFNGATVGGIEKDDRSGGKWTVGRTSSTLCRYFMQFYAKLNFVKLMGKRWFGFSKVEGEEKKPHSEPASTQF